MIPPSWTMRGALLLVVCSLAVLGSGARVALHTDDIERAALALDWLQSWWAALPVLAGIVGVYGARNVIGSPNRAPTSAEMKRDRADEPPAPVELP